MWQSVARNQTPSSRTEGFVDKIRSNFLENQYKTKRKSHVSLAE
jgi:hypothetical protein